VTTLASLPNEVKVHPGHEYLRRNLAFTLDREPGNSTARHLLERIENIEGIDAPILTLGEEREINVFLRMDLPEVRAGLDLPNGNAPATSKEAFVALRALRNRW